MRTIKFRAFDDGKMIYQTGALVKLKRFFSVIREDSIVMQFTGLYDKNGKEIYEGDILTVGENLICEIIYIGNNSDDYGDEINCAFHAKVFKHDKIIPLDGYLKKYCEEIGNIYDNPDLLNK